MERTVNRLRRVLTQHIGTVKTSLSMYWQERMTKYPFSFASLVLPPKPLSEFKGMKEFLEDE